MNPFPRNTGDWDHNLYHGAGHGAAGFRAVTFQGQLIGCCTGSAAIVASVGSVRGALAFKLYRVWLLHESTDFIYTEASSYES